jgi:hypothetical protein
MATLLTSLPPASPWHGVSVAVKKKAERERREWKFCANLRKGEVEIMKE